MERKDAVAALIGKEAAITKLKEEIRALASEEAREEAKKVVTVGGFGCLL